MSFIYRVATLSESSGRPVFPGAHHVSKGCAGYYVAYGPAVNRRHPAIAIMYRDESGRYLIGADDSIMSRLPGVETLAEVVSKGIQNWHTWKCYTDKGNDYIIKTSKMNISVSKTKPVVDSDISIYGGIPTATHGLANFKPTDIEKQVSWIGDKNDKEENENELYIQNSTTRT